MGKRNKGVNVLDILLMILLVFCSGLMGFLFIYGMTLGEIGIMLFGTAFCALFIYTLTVWIKLLKKKNATAREPAQAVPIHIRQHKPVQVEYLDDITFIQDIKQIAAGPWQQYDVLFASRIYGWDMMKSWADYMATAELQNITEVMAGAMGGAATDYTRSYHQHGDQCSHTPELEQEMGMLSIAGISAVLRAPVKVVWFNQTRMLRVFTMVDDRQLMSCYVETMVRRTFGTPQAMKLGKPIPEKPAEKKEPVCIADGMILIDSAAFFAWRKENPGTPQYEKQGSISLREKDPVICLYEDGVKTREYCLETENDEDHAGKFFLVSVRLGVMGPPAAPIAQIDGFISDTSQDRAMTLNDIGYRMEGYFLACGGEAGRVRYERIRGRDLPAKGLKHPGYTTPTNVRLVGVCPSCGKSFCFHGYAFYMAQSDVAYSDDGLDCCQIQEYNIDKDTWTYEAEGKTFRYYNSFNCPHCGTPYIDYKKYPEDKVFGVSGCVLLGRKHYDSLEN